MWLRSVLWVTGSSLLLLVGGVYSFSPTPHIERKIEDASSRISAMIEERGSWFRPLILELLETFVVWYEDDEQISYILRGVIDALYDDHHQLSLVSRYLGPYQIDNDQWGTQVEVTLTSSHRQMEANGLPNHPTGTFPNVHNPHQIEAQSYSFDIPLEPTWRAEPAGLQRIGVAVNGVLFAPMTAEYVDCSDGSQWRRVAVQGEIDLGLDRHHAHVQPDGAYHYHSIPDGLIDQLSGDLVHVGFAADGHLLYYARDGRFTSSYQLKQAPRALDDPVTCMYRNQLIDLAGQPDGRFVEDRMYVAGAGDLDQCNGMMIGDTYAYLLTDTYPYLPRCLHGLPDQSFLSSGPQGNLQRMNACVPGQTSRCCGDGSCGGPETSRNCPEDCQ